MLRLILGQREGDAGQAYVVAANIDDMTPEVLGHFMDTLLDAGALDVWFSPIQMKKTVPA